ncbi:MAG: molybdopterin-guanine dinucleotide biosynthesis protein MobB [Oscillospiraceae bacterium]|jgi:molybdopterin-guanine dinucleotide biosynthesis protein B|nr:molybdopterin-guanine dinucleotide biosynthesis protein MobB [Oscillospiraceae bacterium]
MKVFTVLGTSGSGKTATIEAAVAEFARRGYKVGSVKEIHYEAFAIDPAPTSNTRRHRAAGASPVTARGNRETDVLYPEKLPMRAILRHYGGCGWVALEGVDDLPVPAVICTPDKLRDNAICVSGRFGAQLDGYQGLPAFNALEDPAALCDFLEANVPDYLECYDPDDPRPGADVALAVGGKPVRMAPFVQKILRNAVLGVVGELEGYEEGAEVEIRLK